MKNEKNTNAAQETAQNAAQATPETTPKTRKNGRKAETMKNETNANSTPATPATATTARKADTNPAETKEKTKEETKPVLPYVDNELFPDTQLTREAMEYTRLSLECTLLDKQVKALDKLLGKKQDGTPNTELSKKQRAAKEEERETLKATLKEKQESAAPLKQSAETIIASAYAAGNDKSNVEFLLSLVSTAGNKSIRAPFLKGTLGTLPGSPAESFYILLEKAVAPTVNPDENTNPDAPATQCTGEVRKALETVCKALFSLPFASEASNKWRFKVTEKDARSIIACYIADLTDNVKRNGDKLTVGDYGYLRTITAKTDKNGVITYNADKFMSKLATVILSKVGVNEE